MADVISLSAVSTANPWWTSLIGAGAAIIGGLVVALAGVFADRRKFRHERAERLLENIEAATNDLLRAFDGMIASAVKLEQPRAEDIELLHITTIRLEANAPADLVEMVELIKLEMDQSRERNDAITPYAHLGLRGMREKALLAIRRHAGADDLEEFRREARKKVDREMEQLKKDNARWDREHKVKDAKRTAP